MLTGVETCAQKEVGNIRLAAEGIPRYASIKKLLYDLPTEATESTATFCVTFAVTVNIDHACIAVNVADS